MRRLARSNGKATACCSPTRPVPDTAPKLVEAPDGSLVCLSWLNHDADGHFVGQLSDPMDVDVGPDGPRVIGR